MAIEDEKTKLKVKAVKRKAPAITEVATRQVKAVRRKTDPFAGFLALRQVVVLQRGGLVNEAGGEENGWVVRELGSAENAAWFVMRDEPLLVTFSRFLVDQAYDFDVMCTGACVGELQLQRVTRTQGEGTAYLLGLDGTLLAELRAKGPQSVECFDEAGRSLLRITKEHPTQFDLLVGRRSIGRLLRVAQPGILTTSYELELSFERTATGFERLCAVTAVVTGQAWQLARNTAQNGRRSRESVDLFSLFDD